jgi:hypothetical protein
VILAVSALFALALVLVAKSKTPTAAAAEPDHPRADPSSHTQSAQLADHGHRSH